LDEEKENLDRTARAMLRAVNRFASLRTTVKILEKVIRDRVMSSRRPKSPEGHDPVDRPNGTP
jgi:hypothetical protein